MRGGCRKGVGPFGDKPKRGTHRTAQGALSSLRLEVFEHRSSSLFCHAADMREVKRQDQTRSLNLCFSLSTLVLQTFKQVDESSGAKPHAYNRESDLFAKSALFVCSCKLDVQPT